MNEPNQEAIKTSLNELAKELGLDGFEEFTIKAAAGLMVAQGITRDIGYYAEVIQRFHFDGRPFNPGELSVVERREWVDKLVNHAGQTQIDTALYLDVSQTLVSKDLKALRGD